MVASPEAAISSEARRDIRQIVAKFVSVLLG